MSIRRVAAETLLAQSVGSAGILPVPAGILPDVFPQKAKSTPAGCRLEQAGCPRSPV
jgi:hypothetical protein